ncbi:hypothetical protein GJAV_G00141310 [Gymnothorax javanicus]|nr:hypothetical protein GJAV_G00141310 [Gymnothorax javanicus]
MAALGGGVEGGRRMMSGRGDGPEAQEAWGLWWVELKRLRGGAYGTAAASQTSKLVWRSSPSLCLFPPPNALSAGPMDLITCVRLGLPWVCLSKP